MTAGFAREVARARGKMARRGRTRTCASDMSDKDLALVQMPVVVRTLQHSRLRSPCRHRPITPERRMALLVTWHSWHPPCCVLRVCHSSIPVTCACSPTWFGVTHVDPCSAATYRYDPRMRGASARARYNKKNGQSQTSTHTPIIDWCSSHSENGTIHYYYVDCLQNTSETRK